ncbi:helix-turn-helix transcriptional regulator [Yersinia enterocolitica]|uniref:helix-turn-helix transcriptional regulator n=1 Tax=Yersinia enterocolitica TaxID=630 RepID=UPI003F48C7B7
MMVIIDPIHMDTLRKIFPEIDEEKIEVFTLFAYGMSNKDISDLKSKTPQAISKVLRELCDRFGVSSRDALKAVYAIRFGLYTHLSFYLTIQE